MGVLILTVICLGFLAGAMLGGAHPSATATQSERITRRVTNGLGGVAAAGLLALVFPSVSSGPPPEISHEVVEIGSAAAWSEYMSAHAGEPVIVDFYADWCPPCRMTLPRINEAAAEGIRVVVVDVDLAPDLASRYQITAIPTVMLMKDESVLKRIVGVYTLNDLRDMWARGNAA